MALPSPAVSSAGTSVTTAGAVTATFTHDSAAMWCVTGFEVSGSGATAGSVIGVTLAGLLGGTMTFAVAVPTGVTQGFSQQFEFTEPLWGKDTATDVVLTLPSTGAGATLANASLHGFKVGVNKVI